MDACQDGGEDCLFDEEREEGRGMSAEERGDPDDRKGREGCRLGVLGSTPQINLCGQLMMRMLTFQKHGYIIVKFDFQKF